MSMTAKLKFFTQADNRPDVEATVYTMTRPQSATLSPVLTYVSFWESQTTPTLQRVLNTFEGYFDDVSTDPSKARYLPSAEWITNRLSLIRGILEKRWSERQTLPREMREAYNDVKDGTAKRVKRWDRTSKR